MTTLHKQIVHYRPLVEDIVASSESCYFFTNVDYFSALVADRQFADANRIGVEYWGRTIGSASATLGGARMGLTRPGAVVQLLWPCHGFAPIRTCLIPPACGLMTESASGS